MKIIFLITILFISSAQASFCHNYFKNLELNKDNYESEFADVLNASAKRFNEIEFLRGSDKMDETYPGSIEGYIRNQLRLETELRDRLTDVFSDLVESLANPELAMLTTREIVLDALLVQATMDAKKQTIRKLMTPRLQSVLDTSGDIFTSNRIYYEYLAQIYKLVGIYLKASNLHAEARYDRVNSLLQADVRFVHLDKNQQEAFINYLEYSFQYGIDLRSAAGDFLRKK